jgi:lipoprotein-anchoring transpeptidase ErfK/SrfK
MKHLEIGGSSSPLLDAKKKAPSARLITSPAERPIHPHFVFLTLALLLGSCAAPPDTQHHIVISTREQKLALLDQGKLMATYSISTSKFGLGDSRGSNRTPLGELQIADKIGAGATPGTVFKDRRRTGEVIPVDAPGRDPIVTRIIWLRGREAQNVNAYARTIYIHGTPEERNIGRPASYGCIRMRSRDIINLYEIVGRGASVTIVDLPLAAALPTANPASQMAAGNSSGGEASSASSH